MKALRKIRKRFNSFKIRDAKDFLPENATGKKKDRAEPRMFGYLATCFAVLVIALGAIIAGQGIANAGRNMTKKSVIVCFNYNCEEIRDTTIDSPINEPVNRPADPSREGYSFEGWYIDDQEWDFESDILMEEITLVAHWSPLTFKAVLDANGGYVGDSEVSFDYGSDLILPEAHRDGYYFLGWYLPEKYVNGVTRWIWSEDKRFIARWLPFEPGSVTALFGSYEQDNDLENGDEPIEWYIIEEKDDKYWLISKYVLTGHRYDESNSFVDWDKCILRDWLINDFFYRIFSQDEQNHICPAIQEDTETNDRIFLLNMEESYILRQIGAMLNGEGIGTEYAAATGLEYYYNDVLDFDRQAWWWLRKGEDDVSSAAAGDPGPFICIAARSGCFSLSRSGRSVNGVRPSIWVDKSAVTLIYHEENGDNAPETNIMTEPPADDSTETDATLVSDIPKAENKFVFERLSGKKAYVLTDVVQINDPKVVIPSEYNGMPVTAIGDGAFANHRTDIESIIIPESVTLIGENAFWRCYALESVTFNSGNMSFGSMAFCDCTALSEITIPEGVNVLSEDLFNLCSALETVHLPVSLTEIEIGAFGACESLKTVYYDGSEYQWNKITRNYGWNADAAEFEIVFAVSNESSATDEKVDKISLRRLPDERTIKLCANEKFSYNGLAVEVIYSNGTSKTIKYEDGLLECYPDPALWASGYYSGMDQLMLCGLTTVTVSFEGAVTTFEIDFYAPAEGSLLSDNAWVHIEDGIGIYHTEAEKINTLPFVRDSRYGYDMEKVIIDAPNAVRIESGAFAFNFSSGFVPVFKEIVLPENIEYIGADAFARDSFLENITFTGNKITLISQNMCMGCTSLKSISIPKGVYKIDEYAFSGCTSLTSIALPDGVLFIANYAFEGCSSLRTVSLPDSLRTIEEHAFENCAAIESINVPAGVTDRAFMAYLPENCRA